MGDVHHCSGPPVSEMTYTVSSGTLNPSIPYHTIPYHTIPYHTRRGTKTPVQCGHRTMQISCDPFIQYICNLLYLVLHVCTVKVLLWQKEKREMTMVHLIFPIPFFLNLVTRITWKNSTMAAFPHSMRVRKSKKKQ